MTRFRAFIFDMDGVLIDSHPTHRVAWRDFLESVGIKASQDDLAFILEGRTRSEILRHFLGDLGPDDLRRLGSSKDEFFRVREHDIQPIPGVLKVLQALQERGAALGLATSASEIRTFATIERLGLAGCFDVVVTAADVQAGKPDPAVYQLACQRLSVSPGQALAFDDAIAGVQAARSAGMRCIGVGTNGLEERLLEAGAETVIPDFSCAQFKTVATDWMALSELSDERTVFRG